MLQYRVLVLDFDAEFSTVVVPLSLRDRDYLRKDLTECRGNGGGAISRRTMNSEYGR